MKKNRTMRVAVLMLALALVTCCFVGSTFAKYTSTASGTASATVAKWDIQMQNTEGANVNIGVTTNNTVKFDLFSTIKEEDTTSAEADVKAGKIAPGTGGSFTLAVANKSEVNAKYGVTFALTNEAAIPLEFNVNDGGWKSTLDAVEDVAIAMETGTSDVVVSWRWAFERGADEGEKTTNNAADTLDGVETPTVAVSATIVVEQVD